MQQYGKNRPAEDLRADPELSFQESGVSYSIGELAAATWLSEKGLATILGCHRVTIKRAVQRGELPPPVAMFGQRGWTAGWIEQHIETRLRKAAEEAMIIVDNIA